MTTVLHLTHTSIPSDARILRELDALCRSPGRRVHAYGVLESEAPKTPRLYTLKEFRVRSARATRLSRPARYALVMLELNTRFVLRMLKLHPDVVHCHDTMVLPSGALAKVLLRSTVIYDAHELESNKAGQSRALSMATLVIERVSWPRIDRLITVSPSIAAWYAEHLGPKPTACILNSPEVPKVRTHTVEAPGTGLRDRLEIGPDVPLFVYVGALEAGRGIDLLLRTFDESHLGAHVAFIGSGGLRETIEQASAHHNSIHYCPPVPHEQLVAFIREATGGFCLIEGGSLSNHFCLPNKLFEYAFAGLPIIASRLPDIESLVKRYQLGVCADLTVGSVEEAILKCIASPSNLPIGRLHELSWESQAEDLRGLYEELADGGIDSCHQPDRQQSLDRLGDQFGTSSQSPALAFNPNAITHSPRCRRYVGDRHVEGNRRTPDVAQHCPGPPRDGNQRLRRIHPC